MRSRSEETRKTIITAAHRLFISKGYAGTTVDAIAAKAKLTKRTIYGYFPDKRSILASAMDTAIGQELPTLITLNTLGPDTNLRATLREIAGAINEIVYEPSYVKLLRVAITEIPDQPDLAAMIDRGVTPRALACVAKVLAAVPTHHLKPGTEELASRQFVGGLTIGLLVDGLLRVSPESMVKWSDAQLDAYVDTFIIRIVSPDQEPGKTS